MLLARLRHIRVVDSIGRTEGKTTGQQEELGHSDDF